MTEGDGLISSRFSRTAAMRGGDENRAIGLFLVLLYLLLGLPSLPAASILRCSKQMLPGAGWPLNISAGPYRKAVQQQEQLTITGCCGAAPPYPAQDVRFAIDRATGDRAAALLALHHPGLGKYSVHNDHYSRTKREYSPCCRGIPLGTQKFE